MKPLRASWPRARRLIVLRGWGPAAAVLALVIAVLLVTGSSGGAAVPHRCAGSHFVASWSASPTDSVTPVDAANGPVLLVVANQTLRMVITPHLGGSRVRVHLSNRFGLTSVTFARVSIGVQVSRASVADIRQVRFGGAALITAPAGSDVVSDPVALPFKAFTPLVVSMYVPGSAGPPTKHWDANATSYFAPQGSGDLTGRPTGAGFSLMTDAWFYVDGLDVLAPANTRAIVAFGDSITDGFVASDPLSTPVDRAIADKNGRYPDVLQHRFDAAGIPISVLNAGIGSNRLLTSGEPILMGPSGIQRFDRDALDQAGVRGVLVQEGINDLGLPPGSDAAQIVAGYEQIIAQAHRAGKKIWLGTLLPASNAIVDGVLLAPAGEVFRQQINAWIRSQTLADGVVDFDAALRDPPNPAVLRADYSGPDHLHPNLAGYKAMADAVNLAMLGNSTIPVC